MSIIIIDGFNFGVRVEPEGDRQRPFQKAVGFDNQDAQRSHPIQKRRPALPRTLQSGIRKSARRYHAQELTLRRTSHLPR